MNNDETTIPNQVSESESRFSNDGSGEFKWDNKIKPNQVRMGNKFGETEWQDLPEQGSLNHYSVGKPGTAGELTQKIKAKMMDTFNLPNKLPDSPQSYLDYKTQPRQFEYKQVVIHYFHDVITELNKHGAEGWRCVQIFPDPLFTKVILEKEF